MIIRELRTKRGVGTQGWVFEIVRNKNLTFQTNTRKKFFSRSFQGKSYISETEGAHLSLYWL